MFDTDRYSAIVDRISRKLETFVDICLVTSPEEDWSIAELVAHLIDSASNNHQRFIRLQYESALEFPGYDAETWRRASKAKDMDYAMLIGLWKSYNLYIIGLIARMDPAALDHYWQRGDDRLTLGFLVEDYFRHLVWHETLFDQIAQRAYSLGGET